MQKKGQAPKHLKYHGGLGWCLENWERLAEYAPRGAGIDHGDQQEVHATRGREPG